MFRSRFKDSLGKLAFINDEGDWTIAKGVRHSMELSACMNTLAIFLRGPKQTHKPVGWCGTFHPVRRLVWTLTVTGDDIGEVAVDSLWARNKHQIGTFKVQYLPQTILDNIQIQFPEIYERLLDAADDDSTDSGGSDDDDDDDDNDDDDDDDDAEFLTQREFIERNNLNLEESAAEPAAESAAEPAAAPEVIELVNDQPAEPAAEAEAKRVNEWAKLAEESQELARLVERSQELARLVYGRTVEEPEVFYENLQLLMRITKYLDVVIDNCTQVRKRASDMMIKNFVKFAKEKNNKKRKRN
ncbi:MAG: hypothetical protein ACYSUZ_04200 [Planctomycetota bacterium]